MWTAALASYFGSRNDSSIGNIKDKEVLRPDGRAPIPTARVLCGLW